MPRSLRTDRAAPRWQWLALAGVALAAVLGSAWHRIAGERAPVSIQRSAVATVQRLPAAPRSQKDAVAHVAELRMRLAATNSIDAIAGELRTFLPGDDAHALSLAARVARNSDERYQLVSRLLPAWAAADPAGAWQWAVRRNETWSESGQATLTELVLARLATDSPSAIAAILAGDGWATSIFVDQGVAVLLQAHHLDEARALLEQWARAVASDGGATAPFERTAFALAQDSPARAAEWLLALPPSSGRDAGLGAVADVWASSDAPAAIAWARALPIGDARNLAVDRAFARWVERDHEAAFHWLVANDVEPESDRLIVRWLAVSDKLRANPGAARPWLALIREPLLRAQSAQLFQAQ